MMRLNSNHAHINRKQNMFVSECFYMQQQNVRMCSLQSDEEKQTFGVTWGTIKC